MNRVLGAAVIALVLWPVPGRAQQSLVTPADDTIGRVKRVTGDWFLEGAGDRRQVTAGQELPPKTQLVAGRFAGGGADTRAIDLEMFDGSTRSFACAGGSTCDGPIPLAIESSGFVSLIRSVLRSLHRSRYTPLIIGKAAVPGGVLEIKEGQVELGGMVAMYMHEPAGKLRNFRWCTAPAEQCEPLEQVGGRSDGTDLKVRPKNATSGLYALEARVPNRATTDAAWYVLAVDSQRFAQVYQTYAAIMKLPVFAQLTETELREAQTLLLEAMAATLSPPR